MTEPRPRGAQQAVWLIWRTSPKTCVLVSNETRCGLRKKESHSRYPSLPGSASKAFEAYWIQIRSWASGLCRTQLPNGRRIAIEGTTRTPAPQAGRFYLSHSARPILHHCQLYQIYDRERYGRGTEKCQRNATWKRLTCTWRNEYWPSTFWGHWEVAFTHSRWWTKEDTDFMAGVQRRRKMEHAASRRAIGIVQRTRGRYWKKSILPPHTAFRSSLNALIGSRKSAIAYPISIFRGNAPRPLISRNHLNLSGFPSIEHWKCPIRWTLAVRSGRGRRWLRRPHFNCWWRCGMIWEVWNRWLRYMGFIDDGGVEPGDLLAAVVICGLRQL